MVTETALTEKGSASSGQLPRVIVGICTYRRNDPLDNLLQSLRAVQDRGVGLYKLGAVVVDDNPDGDARGVVESYATLLELGVHYVHSGQRNISIARNLAVGNSADRGDWVAMTDDDCEPSPDWIAEMLETQRAFGVDCMTGPMVLRAPAEAPQWLRDQPFFMDGLSEYSEDRLIETAATHNSMIRSAWWHSNPEVRFRKDLGVTSGEDVVFYQSAVRAGLRVAVSHKAICFGNEPPARWKMGYLFRSRFWLGNSSALTTLTLGKFSRPRVFLQGGNHARRLLQQAIVRLITRKPPHFRYTFVSLGSALGTMLGALGLRVSHVTE
jgi:succinoglycan biosynthesis protein ExoM